MSDYYVSPSRECGERVEGDCYAECGVGSGGRPLEDFFVDPPMPLPFMLPAQGVQLRQVREGGAYHIFDLVGQDNYPNAADILEEGRLNGFSRKLPRSIDFSKLDERSRLMICHARGFIDNFSEYYDAIERAEGNRGLDWADFWRCECRERHDRGRPHTPYVTGTPSQDEMCIRLLWHDLRDGDLTDLPYPMNMHNGRPQVERKMRIVSYLGARTPAGITPKYSPAVIAALPIHRLAVIAGRSDETKARAAQVLKAAYKSSIVVEEVPA